MRKGGEEDAMRLAETDIQQQHQLLATIMDHHEQKKEIDL